MNSADLPRFGPNNLGGQHLIIIMAPMVGQFNDSNLDLRHHMTIDLLLLAGCNNML